MLLKRTHNLHQHDSWLQIHFCTQVTSSSWMKYIGQITTESSRSGMPTRSSAGKVMSNLKQYLRMEKYSRQKDSVDLEVIVWLRHSIVLGPYYGSIQPCIMVCAVCLSICSYYVPRLHVASTVLMLQVPFFICKYLLPNLQIPCSTRQQTNHSTVLFTPDLLTPHTAFLRLHATVPVFWNVSTHFSYPCLH